jgi:hypothetical protein
MVIKKNNSWHVEEILTKWCGGRGFGPKKKITWNDVDKKMGLKP